MAALRYMSGRELETRRSERQGKLAWIAAQVASGDLVIRQATAEERARYGIAGDVVAPMRREPARAARSEPAAPERDTASAVVTPAGTAGGGRPRATRRGRRPARGA